jgi:hypothetical protein
MRFSAMGGTDAQNNNADRNYNGSALLDRPYLVSIAFQHARGRLQAASSASHIQGRSTKQRVITTKTLARASS